MQAAGKPSQAMLRGAIRRMRQIAWTAPAAGASGPRLGRHPTRCVRRTESGVIVERLDLPDAVVLRIRHLVDALGPGRAAAEAAEVRERAPTTLRRLPARIQVNHRLDVHVVVEPAVGQTDVAHLPAANVHEQMLANALLADVDARRIVRDGVVCIKLREVGPHAFV